MKKRKDSIRNYQPLGNPERGDWKSWGAGIYFNERTGETRSDDPKR